MLKNIITEQWQEAKELERTQKIYNTNSVKVYGSRKGGPSASNITNCIRLTWFMAHGYIEKDIVDEGDSNRSLAHMERISDAYMHQDKFVQQLSNLPNCEVLNDDNYWVKCGEVPARVDVRISLNEVIHNIEYKSLGNYSFEKLEQWGLEGIPNYWAQCQVIKGGEEEVPLIFYAKNVENGKTYEEFVEPDFDYIEEVKQKGEDYYNRAGIDNGWPPDRPYEIDSPTCKGCPAREECWFSDLVDGEITKRDIDLEDRQKARALVDIMVKYMEGFEQYQQAHENLKIFMDMLHAKYNFDRIKLRGISSTIYTRRKTTTNWDKIYKFMGEEEYNKVFVDKYVKGQRVNIDWERFFS